MFSIMAFLMCWALFKRPVPAAKRLQYFIVCGLICVAYGIIMEFVQKYYIPNRSFDVADIAADTIGSVLGVIVSSRLYIKK